MTKAILAAVLLAGAGLPTVVRAECIDFSGSWAGRCVGSDPSAGGSELTLSQRGCYSITLGSGDDTLEIVLDGLARDDARGIRALGSWDPDLYPFGEHMRLELVTGTAGVVLEQRYALLRQADGSLMLRSRFFRSVPALGPGQELLATCTLAPARAPR